MYALQQIRNGQRAGKVWMFSSRELACASVVKTYETQEPSSIMETSFHITPAFVQVNTNYMGTLYYTINEVAPSDEAIILE